MVFVPDELINRLAMQVHKLEKQCKGMEEEKEARMVCNLQEKDW